MPRGRAAVGIAVGIGNRDDVRLGTLAVLRRSFPYALKAIPHGRLIGKKDKDLLDFPFLLQGAYGCCQNVCKKLPNLPLRIRCHLIPARYRDSVYHAAKNIMVVCGTTYGEFTVAERVCRYKTINEKLTRFFFCQCDARQNLRKIRKHLQKIALLVPCHHAYHTPPKIIPYICIEKFIKKLSGGDKTLPPLAVHIDYRFFFSFSRSGKSSPMESESLSLGSRISRTGRMVSRNFASSCMSARTALVLMASASAEC